MSWASQRQTTRSEDIAYSLLGLFGVNMPLLYGEGGENAFRRLQAEILQKKEDHSLLLWSRTLHSGEILSKSPQKFHQLAITRIYQQTDGSNAVIHGDLQVDYPSFLIQNDVAYWMNFKRPGTRIFGKSPSLSGGGLRLTLWIAKPDSKLIKLFRRRLSLDIQYLAVLKLTNRIQCYICIPLSMNQDFEDRYYITTNLVLEISEPVIESYKPKFKEIFIEGWDIDMHTEIPPISDEIVLQIDPNAFILKHAGYSPISQGFSDEKNFSTILDDDGVLHLDTNESAFVLSFVLCRTCKMTEDHIKMRIMFRNSRSRLVYGVDTFSGESNIPPIHHPIHTEAGIIKLQSGTVMEVRIKRLGELERVMSIDPQKGQALFVLQLRDIRQEDDNLESSTTEWDPHRFWNSKVPFKALL